MQNNVIIIISLFVFILSCGVGQTEDDNLQNNTDWRVELKEKMPLLGHRNWIVVTDMAYPLQSKQGITTLFAEEPYGEVLSYVSTLINETPHVFSHTFLDNELSFLNDEIISGIDVLKEEIYELLQGKVAFVPHEELIEKLDEISKLYQVVIIKTSLVIPYTSVFFELDCKYWNEEGQAKLELEMDIN